ncbi:MAG: murein biosynthesis integral membrane protein MurJ [Deltaproteobacteria bacterium]|nr:murein biosynthesis integral membrane protein MurJ [Deltaproteobacteria bacterium]MBW2395974.1 murein biosynthesis integral membrane protein MurJ [Deltaproteobacteria bacterium]
MAAEGVRPARVAGVAALLAGSILLSRLLGFVREAVLALRVGRSAAADAYQAGFQLPDLLNYFLAGAALSIAFIPLYNRVKQAQGDSGAERLLATVLGTVAVTTLAATAVLWSFADELISFQFPRFDAPQHDLTVRLTRIVLPAQVFFVVGGVLRAALMAEGRFAAQVAAPLIYNLSIIAGGLFAAPTLGVEGFAWGALIGAAIGPFGFALWDAMRHFRVRLRFAPWDPDFLRYAVLAAPLMLGISLLTVDEWYDRWFGGLLTAGTIATLVYARRLMQVPVALVGQAVATAALPALSKLHSEGRDADLDRLVLRMLQASGSLACLAAAGLLAVADPVVTLLYVRGAFSPADAAPVAGALSVFCLAVPGWVLQMLAVRPFYARGDMWRPMLLGTAVALLAVPLYLSLGPAFGVNGLALAAVLAVSVNAIATLAMARALHGSPPLRLLLGGLLRAAAASLLGAGAALQVPPLLDGTAGALADIVVRGAIFLAVALPLAWWFGDAALREELSRLGGRLSKRISTRP